MKSVLKKFAFLSIVITIFLGSQISLASSVFAGTSGDLTLTIDVAAQERAFSATVCNDGTDDVIGFVLETTWVNYTPTAQVALPPGFAGSNPTDGGTFDPNTKSWEGLIQPSECVAIGFVGDVTGSLGDTIEFTASIVSSTLGDSTPNVDPTPGNDTDSIETSPITQDADISLSTRLLTTGEIESGDTVEYELTITNIGVGDYLESSGNPLGIYFIIPEGTTFVGVTDVDTGDFVDIVSCGSLGLASSVVPAFNEFNAELAGCQLDSTTGEIPSGFSFKLIYTMTANGPFSTGTTKVLAVAVADDADSIALQVYMFTPGSDPFAFESNNTNVLTYDGNELTVTINRCSGIGEVVTTNDACFTITFNKPIYEPEFTQDDLVLTGGGNIYQFFKSGTNEWTVRINGMTPGGIVSLSLEEAGVQDLSAVQNGAFVLGINTVRFELPTSATGTLPETGSQTSQIFIMAIALVSVGMILRSSVKRVLI